MACKYALLLDQFLTQIDANKSKISLEERSRAKKVKTSLANEVIWKKLELIMILRRAKTIPIEPPLYWHALRYLVLIMMVSATSACVVADERIYNLQYTIELQPEADRAQVTIEIDNAELLRTLLFNINPKVHSHIQANGKLEMNGGQAVWHPPGQKARLSLFAKVSNERDDGEFDAVMTKDWAIFRGDDLIPAATVKAKRGAFARAMLEIKLPPGWTSAETGWQKVRDFHFLIDNPERHFDRPTGWVIAGKLGTRRDQVGSTEIVVSAPGGADVPRMEIMTFLNFVWPDIELAFGTVPPKLLIVSAGKPMWRGGLSAPNSLFLHSDRPLVSENGTSSLIHELTHTITRIHGDRNDDWIAEGLAEFYSFELLYRAGGMTPNRREKVVRWLANWGADVEALRKRSSTGRTTARAAVLFDDLDKEIRKRSNNEFSIDDITRELIALRRVSLNDLRRVCKTLMGIEPISLNTALLE